MVAEKERDRSVSQADHSMTASPAADLDVLQEWEGYVVEIGETAFTAHLIDVTAGESHESEEATIPRAELSGEDNAGLCVGSFIRLVVGYERSASGTRKCVSRVTLRDVGRFTEADLRRGEAWARETMRSLGL